MEMTSSSFSPCAWAAMPQASDDGTKAIQIGMAAFAPWRNREEKTIKVAQLAPMERSNEHGGKTLGGRESCELTVLNSLNALNCLNTSCHRLQAQDSLCVPVKNLL